MVLPTAPPASMSVSQIKTETGAPAPATPLVPNNVNSLYGHYGYNSNSCTYFSFFSGKTFAGGVYGPSFTYTYFGGTTSVAEVRDVAVDSAGNIYIIGIYSSATVTVPINTLGLPPVASGYSLPISSGNDVFVIKYSQAGAVLALTTLTGSGSDAGDAIAVDSAQNVYVTGQYNSTTTVPINTFVASSTPVASPYSLPISTSNDVFVIKWSGSTGAVLAWTNLKGSGVDRGYAIAVDSAQNVYVTGQYTSTTTVPINTFVTASVASPYTLRISTLGDVFVIKWSGSTGAVLALTTLKGSGSDNGYAIAVDSDQNVYVTGNYISTATVPINTFVASSTPVASGVSMGITNAASDLFVIKWNANGTLAGYSTVNGTSTDTGRGIAIDSSQNIYVSGNYTSTLTRAINTFGTAPTASAVVLPVSVGTDGLVIKWNANGTVAGYSVIRGTSTDTGYGIAVDSAQNVYVIGTYNSTTTVPINTFGTSSVASGYSLPISSGNDVFVIKWSGSTGEVLAWTNIKGSGSDNGYGIAVDSNSNVYVAGNYSSTTTVPINTFVTTPAPTGYTLPTTGPALNALFLNISGTNTSFFPTPVTPSDTPTPAYPPTAVDPTVSTYTSPGTFIWRPGTAGKSITANVFVVGGGGGGGTYGGGGGGGGVFFTTAIINSNTPYPVTVGAGGASDTNGSPSSFSTPLVTVTAEGGSAGGGVSSTIIGYEGRGGSGSGGGGGYGYKGGTASPQGRNGGNGGKLFITGGGGGAGFIGLTGNVVTFPASGQTVPVGGVGGPGILFPVTGLTYGGGGSGGGNAQASDYTPTPAPGGGGIGGGSNYNATPGTNGLGGGGGGTSTGPNINTTTGGSGAVIIQTPSITTYTFTTPNPATPYTTTWTSTVTGNVQMLLVGGGGAGAPALGGGGGGGVLIQPSVPVIAGTVYTIVVGGGGSISNGGNSTFSSPTVTVYTAIGGGAGGAGNAAGSPGGSGGGGSMGTQPSPGTYFAGGAGTPGQGFDGGYSAVVNNTGGGGGGADSFGGQGFLLPGPLPGPSGGNGGNGKVWPVNGLTYGGGGGGAGQKGNPIGGTGGGGKGDVGGSSLNTAGTNGLGGGGGAAYFGSGGAGGSGTVIIYVNPATI